MKLTRAEKLLLIFGFVKDLFQKFANIFLKSKLLKASACLCLLFVVSIFAFSYKSQAVDPLPSCSSLDENTAAQPGINCLYFGLPLCKDIVAPNVPNHRVNCADIVDLPLCSDIVTGEGALPRAGKNCVDLCSGAAYDNPYPIDHPEWIRGFDFAVFNRDCLRFCDSVEDEIVPNPGSNCAARKCHQLPNATPPNIDVNCTILPCNLLTIDELNKSKFDTYPERKFCEGDNLKCYQFTQTQLKFMRQRLVNPTCIMHNCTPENESCGADDVLNITAQGEDYVAEYRKSIYANLDLSSPAFCRHLDCKPVIKSQYRCSSTTNASPASIHSLGIESGITGTARDKYRNPNCDSVGAGSLCGILVLGDVPANDSLDPITNFCYKTIDCNKAANQSAPECRVALNSDYEGDDDPFESWFYRPKPMDKAVNRYGVILNMDPNRLCYGTSTMNDEHDWGFHMVIDLGFLGTIDFGWFQSSWLDRRSPGACGANHDGNRGTGYIYVCGADQLLYNKADDDAVYFRGYARTDFSSAIPKHKVTICTRFTNTLSLRACGKRECGINEWFSRTTSQACGGDVCRDLIIDEANETECIMTEGLTDGSPGGCSAQLSNTGLMDGYLRVRAVKYNNKICGYFDSKGQLAYNGMFRDGSKSISFNDEDEINPGIVCENDPEGIDGDCDGFDSNSNEGVAHKWRAMLRVHYVDNNRPSRTPQAYRGYLDRRGKLHKEQACPKVTLRVPPPDQYNVATIFNSEKLFTPPVSIRNVTKFRGGSDAIIPSGQIYGKTDFHFPEIKVQYGATIYKMSLGFNYTGYEDSDNAENYPASPSSLVATSAFNGKVYEARLFVRKENFDSVGMPQFCLYRRIKDQNGFEIDPLRLGCVQRESPDINNSIDRMIDPTLPVRKMMIYPSAGSQYDNARINIRYLDGGPNNVDNSCGGDDKCTTEISLRNEDYKEASCEQDIESYKICVKREECSAIYVDCIKNEIQINNAISENQDASAFLAIRRECNESLVPRCNRKKGIEASGGNIFDQIPEGATPDPMAYGWFNELCVVRGFGVKLKRIIAHVAGNGSMGKCFINPASPYALDPTHNCDEGGRAPNCLCVTAPQDYITNAGEEVRLETPREAGLCIDMPLPLFCSAIDYNPKANPDQNDPEYINNSLGKTFYNSQTGVHLTHKDRTLGTVSGNAEFPKSLVGMNNVRGECNGFWTYSRNSFGIVYTPTQSCIIDKGLASWDFLINNQCVRFSCPNVFTAGPDITGLYQGGYGLLEVGENKGLSNGFATWAKYTKTNDFLETRSASECIPGFKPVVSAPVYNADGKITSYSGGTIPSRQCDQLGNWIAPVNSCKRIACAASSPPQPTSAEDSAAWAKWYSSGGATFPAINASRSRVRTQPESIASGTCNEEIGFFQSGAPPSRECDYLGNWLPVKDGCVTSCASVLDDVAAASGSNGYAKWTVVQKSLVLYQHCNYGGWSIVIPTGYYPTSENVAGSNQNIWDASSIKITGGVHADLYNEAKYKGRTIRLTGDVSCFAGNPWNFNDQTNSIKVESDAGSRLSASFQGCVAGYVTNPYPPATDERGEPLPPEIANDLSRPAQTPTRSCKSVGKTYDVWEGVANPCINKCPGFDRDSRIGVGITRHPYASLAEHTIDIRWDTADFNTYSYATNWNAIPSLFNASYFTPSKSNNYYLMRRYCNTDGKWSEPEALCSANEGQIGNATYFRDTASPGYTNSIAAAKDEVVTGTCVASYWNSGRGLDSAPKRKCLFADSYKYIDRVYLDFANDTKDCEYKSCGDFPGAVGQRGKVLATNRSDNTDQRFVAGSGKISSGSCLNNELNSENRVVYTSLDANGAPPYVNCQEDGTWSAVFDSSCKHGCDFGNIDGHEGEVASRLEPFTLAHRESVSSTTFGWNSLTRSHSCDDGNPIVRSEYKGGCVLDVGGIEGASLISCPGWQGLYLEGAVLWHRACASYGNNKSKYNTVLTLCGGAWD